MTDWLRNIRRAIARMPPIAARLGLGRVPDGPAQPTRDPWPGDPARGAVLMRGTFELAGGSLTLRLRGDSGGGFASITGDPILLAGAHSFVWLRDLRALGPDGARAAWSASGSASPPTCPRSLNAPMSPAAASPPGSAITTSSPPPPMTGSASA